VNLKPRNNRFAPPNTRITSEENARMAQTSNAGNENKIAKDKDGT
jgi:hypothetical protein